MSGKITSYIDAKGVKRTGYIVDGRTYEDESATIPVAKGSIVDAGGQRYVKGVGENGESMLYADYLKRENMKATDYVDSQGLLKIGYVKDGKTYADILATTPVESVYSDYLEKEETDDGYTEELKTQAKESYDRALNLGSSIYEAGLSENTREKDRATEKAEADYKALGAQLYRDYMQDKKNLPQLLAAQGISGGISESSAIGLEAEYMNNLSANERARLSAISDIQEEARANALKLYMEKAASDAKAEEDYARRLREIMAEEEASRKESESAAAKNAKADGESLYARAIEKAEILASVGDFSGYKAMGYSDEEIAAMEKAYYEKQFSERLKIAQQKAKYGDSSELLALLGL